MNNFSSFKKGIDYFNNQLKNINCQESIVPLYKDIYIRIKFELDYDDFLIESVKAYTSNDSNITSQVIAETLNEAFDFDPDLIEKFPIFHKIKKILKDNYSLLLNEWKLFAEQYDCSDDIFDHCY